MDEEPAYLLVFVVLEPEKMFNPVAHCRFNQVSKDNDILIGLIIDVLLSVASIRSV
jgi:hypothetical protein